MSERIQLTRKDDTAWGFRLMGGRDFGTPITIVRLMGGSLAEKAGLRVGDIITGINGQKTNMMTHSDIQRCIVVAANYLTFDVLRGSPVVAPTLTPVRGMTPVTSTSHEIESKRPISVISAGSLDSTYEDFSFEIIEHNFDEEKHEPTEDEIAQMLLENAEVLEEKGKNVIGVNFNRFIPKCDFIKDSAVFQVLQEEQVYKEMSEKEQLRRCPNKRFSTFLALPTDRPIPKPKEKQVKMDNHSPQVQNSEENNTKEIPDNTKCDANIENQETTGGTANVDICHNDNVTCCDDNVICCDEISTELENNSPGIDLEEGKVEGSVDQLSICDYNDTEQNGDEVSSDNQNEFDKQLVEIKAKLDSLQQLPSMIEFHLIQVQKQIENLIQLKRNPSDTNLCQSVENCTVDYEIEENKTKNSFCEGEDENNEELLKTECQERDEILEEGEGVQNDENENLISEEHRITNENNQTCHTDENANNQSTNQKDNGERKQREKPVFPLTPMPRPVVLPGGRRWRRPKDAFNEQFIAETLISQAEVLVGSTLGVNFSKYEPPKFDMSNSAVYKLVHDLESKSKGIANRPEIVPAEEDYYHSPDVNSDCAADI